MTKMSNFLENEILDHILGTGSWTMPANVYLALYTTDPTDADSGTEVSGGSYARQSVAFTAAAAGVTANTSDIEFPQATANWGTITHVGIRDAESAGNLLLHGALDSSVTINNTDTFIMDAGDLDVGAD